MKCANDKEAKDHGNQLDATVIEEADESWPARERVSDQPGGNFLGDARQHRSSRAV
jgi:hypothetical protein